MGVVHEIRLMAHSLRLEAEMLAADGDAAAASRLELTAEIYDVVLAALEGRD